MKKSNIILSIFNVILSIALIIIILLYLNAVKISKNNLESQLTAANEVFELNKKVQELEEELEQYKNPSITTTVTNTVNTNKVTSTEPYIPDGMQVADPNYKGEIKASDVEIDYDLNKVKIEVLKDTITNTYAEILITDNNGRSWGESYRIQVKKNSKWEEVAPISDLNFIEIGYNLDENNQFKQKIKWERLYGELEKGTYRIVKPIYLNEYIDLYSDEFEIK
ncbi:MAG: hypothetical protein J6J60_08675 [Clostridia bacterium]|nr:hypothetical protein [Clostridia bacterium]